MTELEDDAAGLGVLARAPVKRFHDTRAGAPCDVKPRHRVTVPHGVIAAPLGPADHGKNAVAHGLKPAALLADCEGDVSFRPLLRPVIFIAVESRSPHPVLQSEVMGILDAKPPLFGCIDKK